MKETTLSSVNVLVVPIVLAVLAAGIVYAAVTGKQVPLISSPRSALIGLLVIGFLMCAAGGINQVGVSGKWASPLAIWGYLCGTAILVVAVAAFAGWKLPWIAGDRQAVMAIGGLMTVKFVIGTLGYLFHLL
jgi:hypothetical protein